MPHSGLMPQRVAHVATLKAHRHNGTTFGPGATYELPRHKIAQYASRGWVRMIDIPVSWHDLPRRELRISELPPHGLPIVACLNIWDHAAALTQALPTWLPGIDAIVVADGPYHGTGCRGPSGDNLKEVLARLTIPVAWVPWDNQSWADQPTKRTALLQHAAKLYPQSVLLIVDADESLRNAKALRAFGGDVGWVQVTSPLYNRPANQPRLVLASPDLRYDKRHHWLYKGERLLASHQYGGTAVLHQVLDVQLHNDRNTGMTRYRLDAKSRYAHSRSAAEHPARAAPETAASDKSLNGRETLRILQLANYDIGMVIYRLHTGINATTPHASAFGVLGQQNPFHAPTQFLSDTREGKVQLAALAAEADVFHLHINYFPLQYLKLQRNKPVVMHHHGTAFRRHASKWENEDKGAVLRLVSNLELLQYGNNLHWLPNPVPVAEYRRLRVPNVSKVFRLGHSPSRRLRKGTDVLLNVVKGLKAKGLKIELVLMESMSHGEVIRTKATCDACFDSFWLGIQCSGLEAAAMGLPVIAGDVHVADKYRATLGAVPYTYANDAKGLTEVLERLVLDQDFRTAEAERVSTYCERYHDEAAVALRYLDLLDTAIGWRTGMKAGRA